MNVLIVYAHHEPSSFTAAMKNLTIQVLEGQGHTLAVSDLYGQGFSAVAQKWDFVTTSGNHFNYMLEQKHAVKLEMSFSPDIAAEIQKLQTADIVLFIAPIWWLGPPAIMKGWFDRVLAMGFAWDTDRIFENGLLRGKQAMVIAAAGGPPEYFSVQGRYKMTPTQSLFSLNYGTLGACGFNVHQPHVALNVLGATEPYRRQMLKDLEIRIQNLATSPQWLIYYS